MKKLAVVHYAFERAGETWEFKSDSKIPKSLNDFVLFQLGMIAEFGYPILEIGCLLSMDCMRFKVLTDCHGDTRTYSVNEWVITDEGLFERAVEFQHTDEDSNCEGANYFHEIDLSIPISFEISR